MAGGQEKWYFTKEQLQNSPSRKCGLDADKELAYRQQAANLIQDMGQRLEVSQLCIITAIVYMHRFYAFHSFTQFHRNAIAAAALLLAAKVEERPIKLEHVIKVAHVCTHRDEGVNALTSEQHQQQAQDLVFNENVLLQTLSFDVAIEHPHTHVVRTCHLVKAPKDLAQTSYFMASNSLHLTTMCLQYRPTVVACFCIHLASKWSNWAIPQSKEGRHWFSYVDRSVTMDLLEKLISEFLIIYEKCPSRLKRNMMNVKAADDSSRVSASHPLTSASQSSTFGKKHPLPLNSDDFNKSFDKEYERERRRQPVPGGYVPATTSTQKQPAQLKKIDYNLYRENSAREEQERKEERAKREQQMQRGQAPPRPGQQVHNQRRPQYKPHHQLPPKTNHHQKSSHDYRHHIPGTSSSTVPPQSQPPGVPRIRPPSIFSPENTTTPAVAAAALRRPQAHAQPQQPAKPQRRAKPEFKLIDRQPSPKKRPDPTMAIREMQLPASLSRYSSSPLKNQKPRQSVALHSEPELEPAVKKLDKTARDPQRSVKAKTPERKEERLNGFETDPTLVWNLLKASLAKPLPIIVPTEKSRVGVKKEEPPAAVVQPEPSLVAVDVEHNDDISKNDRKKHKQNKDQKKKREKNPVPVTGPQDGLRITKPRDKLSSPGLKNKIPIETLAAPPPPPNSRLKIKMSKEILQDTSRKRTNDKPTNGPLTKLPRQNGTQPRVDWEHRPPLPYYVYQPPPPLYYGGYYCGMDYMYQQPSQPQLPQPQQPPLPAPVPPPPPPPE